MWFSIPRLIMKKRPLYREKKLKMQLRKRDLFNKFVLTEALNLLLMAKTISSTKATSFLEGPTPSQLT